MGDLILDGHKLAWHRDRVEAWLRGERIAPITIDCALTRRCNFKCQYCFGQLQGNDEKVMTREVIFRFLDDATEIGVKAISFVSDGESTCSPYLYEAILRGKANGLDMALGTNGYALDPDRYPEVLSALTYLRFNTSAGERDRYARIHGVAPKAFDRVCHNVAEAVRVKRELGLPVTLGLQMVLMPDLADQILPVARLGAELGVDYAVIKHCSDDEQGSLGIDYGAYDALVPVLEEAEAMSTPDYLVKVKWSKVLSGGKRSYSRCYGPPFILQMSGSGLVAPCGMLFNERYSRYHIGNVAEQSFKEIWESDRYWEVMGLIASEEFDAHTMCGTLCLQHKVNECLAELVDSGGHFDEPAGPEPGHVNFI